MSNVQAQVIPMASEALKLSEIHGQNDMMGDMDENTASSGGDDSDNSSSDSDDGSDSTSSTDSADTEGSKTLEQAEITDEILQLPRDLCEYESVFRDFFTEDLWTQLGPAERLRLQSKLPDFSKLLEPHEALAEQQHTVQLLFQNRLQRFGRNPLLELHRNLQTGNYRPDIKALRRSIMKSQRREQRFRECERIGYLAKRMFIARERFLRKAYNSAPDEIPHFEKTLQKHQNQHSFLLNADTKICAVRARKRFYAEIADLKKQAANGGGSSNGGDGVPSKSIGFLSADEEDKDDDALMHLGEDLHEEEMSALKSAATFASTTDKCIYDTFFQRRSDFTDEEAMRLSQYAKRPKLTNRNFKQYVLDYKQKKLTEPNLPEYETTDIRLRDVCARAQIGGSFKRSFPLGQKPGRKPKSKMSEPPALVPIMQTAEHQQATYQKQNQNLFKQQQQQLLTPDQQQLPALKQTAAKKHEDQKQQNIIGLYHQHCDADGVELQQEEVETSIPAYTLASNEIDVVGTNVTTTVVNEPIRNLPKLEPISQRQIVTKKSPVKTAPSPVLFNATPAVATGPSSELIQETHSCYFALIRDFFCATPNHRMKFEELKQRIHIWLNNPITALNDWYAQASNWSALLVSAVKFLAGDYVEQPPEYVPYIEYKSQLNIYQWIGAGRDSDARLTTLCNFWLEHRKELHLAKPPMSVLQMQQQQQLKAGNDNAALTTTGEVVPSTSSANISPPPPTRYPTNWTVRPATPDEIAEFRRQERERFEQPHRAYTYRMHGYESVVGPVRGIYTQGLALTKARGHSMMVDDRPNFVTILTLVRDATARLPNGEGTRADISELLKCSQYINPHVAENVMQSIVSGALDRLHTENDACVRYDSKRKIWIYLHRNRTEAEFERMHQKQQGQAKLAKLTKVGVNVASTPPTVNMPTSIVETPATGAILNATRKMLPKIVGKTLPTKDNISSGAGVLTMPALVPAVTTSAAANSKTSQPVLPKTVLPVPPLKYNIPAAVLQQQQQKSLLKTTAAQQQQRRFIDAKTGATLLTTGVAALNAAGKQIGYSLPTGRLISVSAAAATPTTAIATAKATPPLTATVAGKRVALSKPIIINQINNKPTTNQQQQQVGNQNKFKTATQVVKAPQKQAQTTAPQGYIIPISGNSNLQLQSQPQFMQINSPSAGANVKPTTIVMEPKTIGQQQTTTTAGNESLKSPAPKNIIRFVQNAKQQQQQQIVANNKIIGQRLIASPIGSTANTNASGNSNNSVGNLSIRGKILTSSTTITTKGNSSAASSPVQEVKHAVVGTSTIGNLPGTIIKMSPQAFNALQQKGQVQHIVKAQAQQQEIQTQQQQQQQPTQQRQQRLIIGNTAIIAHGNASAKNMLLQQQQQQQSEASSPTPPTLTKMILKQVATKSVDAATSTTPTTVTTTPATTNKIQMLNATSLTPQQQRILIQNFKQQQQQQTSTANKPMTVVVSQSPVGGIARLIKTTTPTVTPKLVQSFRKNGNDTSTPSTPTISKTITFAGKTAGQIVTLNTTPQTTEVGNTIITQTAPRNIIAIGSGASGATAITQQRLITTTGGNKAITNLAAGGGVRVIRSVSGGEAITNNQGPGTTTYSIANIQGKQVVIATKSPANAAGVKQITTNVASSSAGSIRAANSVIIGGQTIKLQGNQTLKTTGGTSVTKPASTTQAPQQLQTVIMGNQILRVLPQNLISAKTVTRSEPANTQSPVQNRIITVSAAGSPQASTSASTTNLAPKTLVLNSGTQTIRFQSAASATPVTQDINQKTLQKSAASGNRVVLAVPGGGQILLPTGGTLNLKSLQNMKLVSLAQVQQQHQNQQDKTKNNTTTATATTLAKS